MEPIFAELKKILVLSTELRSGLCHHSGRRSLVAGRAAGDQHSAGPAFVFLYGPGRAAH